MGQTKKIKVDSPILTVYGKQGTWLKNPTSAPEPLYFKDVFLELLPYAQVYGEDIVSVWDLALKIKREEKEVELTGEEMKLLKRVVKENSIGRDPTGHPIQRFAVFVIAQVLKELNKE